MDTSFPPGIFQNLSSLTSLDISGNDEDLFNPDYPGQALSDLVNLQELAIDGLYNQGFPSDFAAMPSLYTLNLGGPYTDYCYLGTTDTYTFQYFQHLETLNISNCRLKTSIIYNGALFGVNNLKTFDISWNYEYGIDGVFELLQYFPDTLEYLYANYITPFYDPGTSITTIRAGMLPRGLRYAEARGNRFETVEAGVFEALPENLTYLDVSDNRFVFGAYLANISLMANLEILLLNGADVVYNLPKNYPSSNASVFSAASSGSFGMTSKKFFFQLPPKLIRLNMIKAGLSYRLTQISINPNNSLEELNLDHNVFSQLTGPLYGLDRLTSLSMSGCSIETIEETFFKNLTSLEILDLSDNRIGLYLPAYKNVSLFEDLVHLKYLNLSFNSIPDQESSQDFFKGLDSLEELYMQNNRMWTFEMDISNLYELRVLNLSSNFVSSLSSNITSFIHGLVRKPNTTIEVDLSGNAIKCDCGNLDFLKWLSSSKATNESFFTNIYICAFPDDDVFSFVKDRYVSVIHKLSRECTSKYALFLFSLSGTLILVSVVLVLILYRFRWNLRYLYYAAYLSFKKGVRPVVTEEDYPYDVFVSYAWPDEQFILDTLCPALESRDLKLHVHGRDFLVGDYIASNIVTAVKESRKTLVVLTRALLDSTWCNYEIQMANMESVHTGRPVLIFLIKESVSNRQLGQNLLSHIRNNTYIPYPEAEPNQEPGNHLLEAFWDKLATDLKS